VSLSHAEVSHLAHLARLHLEPQELERMRIQVSAILDYVAQLQELDLTSLPPTSQVTGLVSVMRDDVVATALPAEVALAAAPDRDDSLFRVKAVFGEGDRE
jgi:aspartyl-tRNA(Asn)/glutamyl-tRNA(Gln) amidotransferase subunit C